ncbi:hypothetical protein LBMAG45_07070 [Nitrospirota bacterium]|nr:hypothetical protein LBMAG45_07070 [Nitrospirota bacterium]
MEKDSYAVLTLLNHLRNVKCAEEAERIEPKDQCAQEDVGQTEGAESPKELRPPMKRPLAETYSQVTRSAGRM